MKTNIVLIGSVSSKQYQEFRLRELQAGNKPQIVRINTDQFMATQVMPVDTNLSPIRQHFNDTYHGHEPDYVPMDEDHPDFTERWSMAYEVCLELLQKYRPLAYILMEKKLYQQTHDAAVLEAVLDNNLPAHPWDAWLIEVD